MKKLLIILLSVLTFISFLMPVAFSACEYNEKDLLSNNLEECIEGSKLVKGGNLSFEKGDGFAEQIKKWTNNIALYLGVFAVGSIIIGSLMMTISIGEEEKIKKGKDIVMWGMIGFIGLISVSAIINLVVKIMYSI